jgi:membrane protease YdiL (CAAX protease family)
MALFSQRSLLARIFISPSERRLRAGWRLLIQTLMMFAILSAMAILIGMLFARFPGQISSLMLTSGEFVSFLAVTLSIYLARRWLDRRSFASLGVKWDHFAPRDLLMGIGLAGAMIALIFLVEWAMGWLVFKGFAWDFRSLDALLLNLVYSALLFVGVGWTEELLGRGYWLQNLSEGINLTWGVLLSSFFFALAHLSNPNFSWMALIGLFASGLFFAFAYLRTGQLWLPIGLHIGWNFFEGNVFGFQVSGLEMERLILQEVQGPSLFTGGEFGPEAGLILFPVLLLTSWVIYLYTRDRIPKISRNP